MLITLSLIITAYLLGSISAAILVCKLLGIGDPREQGSNNPGATNVLRIGGKKAAVLTLAGDLLKGLIPVLVGHYFNQFPFYLGLIGFAAFLGHLYPIFFHFRGGKGVATALGVLIGLHYLIGLTVVGVWLLVAAISRYSSLSALVSMFFAPAIVWWYHKSWDLAVVILVMSSLLFWRHRSNIRDLWTGKEDKFDRPLPKELESSNSNSSE